jgi:hypothetical protein
MSLGGNISHNLRWVGVVDFVAGRVFLCVLAMAMKFTIYDLTVQQFNDSTACNGGDDADFIAVFQGRLAVF